MIRLPDSLLEQLTAVVTNVLGDPLNFGAFTKGLDAPFALVVSPNDIFQNMQRIYIRQSNNSGGITPFIKKLLNEFGEHDDVKAFKKAYDQLIDPEDPDRYQKNFFDPCLLASAKLCFLSRKCISNKVYEIVHNGLVNNHIFLNGESGTGLSYISMLLREVAEHTNAFEVVKIDLNVIFSRIKGQIQMEHVANEFVKNMSGLKSEFLSEGDGKFKYEVFYNDLRTLLDKTDERYFFFLDQFNNPYSDEVGHFVQEFTSMIFEAFSKRHCLILSGFRETNRFRYEIESTAETIRLSTFELAEVAAYVRKLHTILEEEYNLDFTAEEMLSMLSANEQFFDPKLYQQGAQPNVTAVGRGITTWLRNFKQQLPSA